MSKTQSGIILILIAVIMNVVGGLLAGATRGSDSVGVAGFMTLFMFAAVVVGLFGLFRLVSGLITKK